jgi:hypothetical protein
VRLLCLPLVFALAAVPAAAERGLTLPVASAPARALAAELKAAQAGVDAALKQRRARHTAWQRAVAARDAAAAEVQRQKKAKAATLEVALRRALALDEEAAVARSALSAAEAEVARGGAQLLRLYDALLVERRKQIEAMGERAAQRGAAVVAYKELTAQRDAVRLALLPVLDDAGPRGGGADLEPRADDDVETLLEKADLARDLEERYLRQAETVRRRILELEDEAAVARDVVGMVGRSQLFDEEDRRLFVVRTEAVPAARSAPAAGNNDNRGSGTAPPPEFAEADPDTLNDDAPSAAVTPVTSSPALGLSAPVTTSVRAETAAVPATDTGIASLLSSPTVSMESLRALEKKLKDDAQRARERSRRLKVEAEARGRE